MDPLEEPGSGVGPHVRTHPGGGTVPRGGAAYAAARGGGLACKGGGGLACAGAVGPTCAGAECSTRAACGRGSRAGLLQGRVHGPSEAGVACGASSAAGYDSPTAVATGTPPARPAAEGSGEAGVGYSVAPAGRASAVEHEWLRLEE